MVLFDTVISIVLHHHTSDALYKVSVEYIYIKLKFKNVDFLNHLQITLIWGLLRLISDFWYICVLFDAVGFDRMKTFKCPFESIDTCSCDGRLSYDS